MVLLRRQSVHVTNDASGELSNGPAAAVANAVSAFLGALSRAALGRLARAIGAVCAGPDGRDDQRRRALATRFGLDLAGFLNLVSRSELDAIAAAAGVANAGSVGSLRARLWAHGAALEAGGPEWLGTPVQPVPVVLRGKLVHLAAGNGLAPPSPAWPRPVPTQQSLDAPGREPDTLEELLANADALLGVRLGGASRNKGAFGIRVASLLGVAERGHSEPDWRGEVEIKTVPVVRDASGFWRVKEDPAVSMKGARPLAKLCRVLWIARVADGPDSPVLSWYYQERDAAIATFIVRDLHTRPKGGKGATSRGWYLHKRFFVDSGFLGALNG